MDKWHMDKEHKRGEVEKIKGRGRQGIDTKKERKDASNMERKRICGHLKG